MPGSATSCAITASKCAPGSSTSRPLNLLSDRDNAARACLDDAERCDVIYRYCGHAVRRRREMCELGERRVDRVTEGAGKAARDRRRGFHGDLLTEYGA